MKKIYFIYCLLLMSITTYSQEQTMYWIGGAGNWDDLNHWSFQSGTLSSVLPSSVPTTNTNVIFDGASGFSGTGSDLARNVNIRSSGVIVKSLTFADDLIATNSPRFIGGNSLVIENNIILKPYVTFYNVILSSGPGLGETAEITWDGATLSTFVKTGAGTTIIKEKFPTNINLTIQEGKLQYEPTSVNLGDVFLFKGELDLLNVDEVNIRNLSDRNSPKSEGNLVVANNTKINVNNWIYRGNVSTSQVEVNINGSIFEFRSNSIFDKININSNYINLPQTSQNNKITINEFTFKGSEMLITRHKHFTINKFYIQPQAVIRVNLDTYFEIKETMEMLPSSCNDFYRIESVGIEQSSFINATGGDLTLDNGVFILINFNNPNNHNTNIAAGYGNIGAVTINTPVASNFYWVGNGATSEWNDPANWSNTPSGASGECLPTILDNVFITSTTALNINVTDKRVFIHNIVIDAPEFKLSGLKINITGSWTMSANAIIETLVEFGTDSNGNTITSNNSIFDQLGFSGRGSWILQDNLKTAPDKGVYFYGGTINTNEKNVFIGGFFDGGINASGNFPRTLNMQKSEFSVEEKFYFGYSGTVDNLFANEAGSHIIFRNGRDLTIKNYHIDKITVYDESANNTNLFDFYYYDSAKVNDLTIYAKSTVFIPQIGSAFWERKLIIDNLKIIPSQGSPVIIVRSHLTVGNFEVGPLAKISFVNHRKFNILNSFISNTLDCTGLMQLNVLDKIPGHYFNLISQNDIFINNVVLDGVKAADNGVSYKASGIAEADTTGFEIISQQPKNLYWIGQTNHKWNEPLNWTTDSSGLTSQNPCVPTSIDNVYFETFSGNGIAGLNVSIINTEAYFKNFYAANAPSNMVFTGANMNGYGDVMEFGSNSKFVLDLHHFGLLPGTKTTLSSPDENAITFTNIFLKHPLAAYIWDFDINFDVTNILTMNDGIVNLKSSTYKVGNIIQIGTIFNFSQNLTVKDYYRFYSGEINAQGATLNGFRFYSESGLNRKINFTDAQINMSGYFMYTKNNAEIIADGSHFIIDETIYTNPGHHYNIIEVPFEKSLTIESPNSIFNELLMSGNAYIKNDLTVDKLFMKPQNLILTLDSNVKLTIEKEMLINGTPCYFNEIISTSGDNSLISYANPNGLNEFDFVKIRRIDAVDAYLIFNVNSSVIDCNIKVIKKAGEPGIDGLGEDAICQTSFFILAYNFYGGPLSTYKWYKTNEVGDFEQLNVPLNTLSIDVRDFGLDGTYKVDMVYDSTVPENLQCKQTDTITLTFKPEVVVFENDILGYCIGESKTIEDIIISQETLDFMESSGAILNWYDSLTDGNLLPESTILSDGTYYASLTALNGCISETRSPVLVSFNAIPVALAGPNQNGVTGATFTMQANNPTVGIGKWSVVEGDATIINLNAYNTTVILNSGDFAKLKWEVNNNGCIKSDSVLIGGNFAVPKINPSMRMRVSK